MTDTSIPRPLIAAGEIVVSGVSKNYGVGHLTKEVVRDCNFTIERGKLTVMIGPSGCGKSTLIRLLAGFEQPTTGTITIDGKAIDGPSRDRLVVFQDTALFPWMSTYDNILYGPRARGELTAQTLEFAEFLLNKVGLQEFRKKYPTQLSETFRLSIHVCEQYLSLTALYTYNCIFCISVMLKSVAVNFGVVFIVV